MYRKRICLWSLQCSLWRDERITFFPVTLKTKRAILSLCMLKLDFSVPAWKNQYQTGLWNRNHKGSEQFEKNISNRRDWLKISCWLIVFYLRIYFELKFLSTAQSSYTLPFTTSCYCAFWEEKKLANKDFALVGFTWKHALGKEKYWRSSKLTSEIFMF